VSARDRDSDSQPVTDNSNSGESNKLPVNSPLSSDTPASALKKKGATGYRIRFFLSEPTSDRNNYCRSICCRSTSSDRVRHPTAYNKPPISPRHVPQRSPAETRAPIESKREPAITGDQEEEATGSDLASDERDERFPPTKRRRVARQILAVPILPTEKSKERYSQKSTVVDEETLLQPHIEPEPRSILDIIDIQRERQASIPADTR
jgi:hypothetical protein